MDNHKDISIIISTLFSLFLTATQRWSWCILSMPIPATASVLSLNPKVDTLPRDPPMLLFLYGTPRNSTARGHYLGRKELLVKIYFWWVRDCWRMKVDIPIVSEQCIMLYPHRQWVANGSKEKLYSIAAYRCGSEWIQASIRRLDSWHFSLRLLGSIICSGTMHEISS